MEGGELSTGLQVQWFFGKEKLEVLRIGSSTTEEELGITWRKNGDS